MTFIDLLYLNTNVSNKEGQSPFKFLSNWKLVEQPTSLLKNRAITQSRIM